LQFKPRARKPYKASRLYAIEVVLICWYVSDPLPVCRVVAVLEADSTSHQRLHCALQKCATFEYTSAISAAIFANFFTSGNRNKFYSLLAWWYHNCVTFHDTKCNCGRVAYSLRRPVCTQLLQKVVAVRLLQFLLRNSITSLLAENWSHSHSFLSKFYLHTSAYSTWEVSLSSVKFRDLRCDTVMMLRHWAYKQPKYVM